MDSSQQLEYLNRENKKKFSGWKNYSPNVWDCIHWRPELLAAADKRGKSRCSNRPSTAPPKRFGLKYNPKNEMPKKVDYLMHEFEDMQHQMRKFKKTIAQQNILIDDLTTCVEKLSMQQTKISNKQNENEKDDESITIDNDSDHKKQAIVDDIVKSVQPKATNKDKKAVIPTFYAVNPKEIKSNKKQSKPTKASKKGLNKRKRARANKPITPRVVKTNKCKKKQIKL